MIIETRGPIAIGRQRALASLVVLGMIWAVAVPAIAASDIAAPDLAQATPPAPGDSDGTADRPAQGGVMTPPPTGDTEMTRPPPQTDSSTPVIDPTDPNRRAPADGTPGQTPPPAAPQR